MSERPRDRVRSFLAEPTPRRVLTIALFLAMLVLFRKLLVLLVFFVASKALLERASGFLQRRVKMGPKAALLTMILVVLAAAGGAGALGVGRGVRALKAAQHDLPARIAAMPDSPTFAPWKEHLEEAADKLVEGAQHYAASALKVVSAFGHVLLYALIGFILAVVFLLEREELEGFARKIEPRSVKGTLLRWSGHVADAMLVTVQFQLVVAACNAVLTIPVLLLIGIPHAPSLGLMIFVSGLVPVVGNVVSGAILSLLAFQVKGWLGVGIFTGLTFILHKLESYYLNPRLAARHVKLPGFVLIVSLILFEHVLGFAGLFLSFPTLFVAQRITQELRDEPEASVEAEPAQGIAKS